MKRLIFTVTNDLNFDQRMIRICSTLAEAGYKIELIGRRKKSSQPTVNQSFTQTRLSLFFEKGFLFYAEFNLRLFLFLLFKKADLICSIDLDTLPAGYLAARLSGKKIVYDAHEYFSEVPEVVERPKVKKIWEWIGDFFVPKVTGAYTVGKGLRGIFEEKFGVEFGVIRNVPFKTKKSDLGFAISDFRCAIERPEQSHIANRTSQIVHRKSQINLIPNSSFSTKAPSTTDADSKK